MELCAEWSIYERVSYDSEFPCTCAFGYQCSFYVLALEPMATECMEMRERKRAVGGPGRKLDSGLVFYATELGFVHL